MKIEKHLCSKCQKHYAVLSSINKETKQEKLYCAICALEDKIPEITKEFDFMGINSGNAQTYQELFDKQIENFSGNLSEKDLEILKSLQNSDSLKNLSELFKNFEPKNTQDLQATKKDKSINNNLQPGNEKVKNSTDEEDIDDTKNQNFIEQLMNMMDGKKGIFKIFKGDLDNSFDLEQFAFQDVTGDKQEELEDDSSNKETSSKNGKRKYLDQFGTNLNSLALNNKLDKVIGRDIELSRVIQILNRRNKNNPVLIGEPGVGKTALAEGLALKIVKGEVPLKLSKMEVYLIDMASLVAGTQFRGQFESRLKGLIKEARAEKNIILVIDELHNIIGAGHAEGTMNAANILKPALARGEIRVLGSTTLVEYRKFIEKDAALERRFQKVLIDEPSIADTIKMLKENRNYYEKYHNVTYGDNVINEVVRLAERYIPDRFFPDKAFDIIDEAGSQVNLGQIELMQYEQKKEDLANKELKLVEIENKLEKEQEKGTTSLELFEERAKIKEEKEILIKEIEDLKKVTQAREITLYDIAKVVELWTGIPVQSLTETEKIKLLNLNKTLDSFIIGQNEAKEKVVKTLKRTKSGLFYKAKPVSFILVGPTGVGKTELVKSINKILHGDEKSLIRLDMSEYMEAHTVSKLIGSPPGYVGHEDAGQLTEQVRRRPYSIILLDEIEKAHKDVYNMLLQILDDGRLTDSKGRLVDFSNTIIFMTSNAGTSFKQSALGFLADDKTTLKEQAIEALKKFFKPEFLNRIDEIIYFTPLAKDEQANILNKLIIELQTNLKDQGIELEITQEAKDFILEKGFSPNYGARPLKRAITTELEDLLADLYLKDELALACKIKVDHLNNQKSLTVSKL